jgi:hypothetical protein
MKQEKGAGVALIAGPLAGIITMALHPTGHALSADFASVAPVNRAVHALAIAGTITTAYGLVRLSRQLARDAVTDAALVSYGFGAIAVMFAALASGFIATDLTARVIEAGADARTLYDPAFDFGWALNQATTRVYVLAASFGIGLWSIAMLSDRAFGRGLTALGLLVALVAAVATVAGMPMDIHGFGAIALGHGTWFIWTGVRLLRQDRQPGA